MFMPQLFYTVLPLPCSTHLLSAASSRFQLLTWGNRGACSVEIETKNMEESALQLPDMTSQDLLLLELRRRNIYAGECIFAPLWPLLLPVQAFSFHNGAQHLSSYCWSYVFDVSGLRISTDLAMWIAEEGGESLSFIYGGYKYWA